MKDPHQAGPFVLMGVHENETSALDAAKSVERTRHRARVVKYERGEVLHGPPDRAWTRSK